MASAMIQDVHPCAAEGGRAPARLVPSLGRRVRCDGCGRLHDRESLARRCHVCPGCDRHLPVPAPLRIAQLLDRSSFAEWFADLRPCDPLGFVAREPYGERLAAEQLRVGTADAGMVGLGRVRGVPVVFGVTDSRFLMGGVGSVVGEKLTRAIELATRRRLPLVVVSSSGGARMHEGAFSLMQMAKVAAALARFDAAGGLFISVLSHPTIGGASFVYLGDVVLAEPGALVGFASLRVIAKLTGNTLPESAQTSESFLERGFVDRIVHRHDLRETIARLLEYLGPGPPEDRADPNTIGGRTRSMTAVAL